MTWQVDNGRQLYSLFLSCGCGFWLALVYELFEWCRRRARHQLAVVLWDAVYMVVAAITLFLFSLPLTGGRLRWYILLGAGVGFVACRQTVGRLLHIICRFLSSCFHTVGDRLKGLFVPILRFVSWPIMLLKKKHENYFKKREEKRKNPLQHSEEVVYNQDNNN